MISVKTNSAGDISCNIDGMTKEELLTLFASMIECGLSGMIDSVFLAAQLKVFCESMKMKGR